MAGQGDEMVNELVVILLLIVAWMIMVDYSRRPKE